MNTVHLAWDVMVGIGTLLFLLSAWYGAAWLFRRDMPKTQWFLRIAARRRGRGRSSRWRPGWVVTEVGRQPWIVVGHMKVEDAATDERGRVGHVPRRRRALPRRRGHARPGPAGA